MEENKFNPFGAYIVCASDDGFAEILGVSMVSLHKNSRDIDAIYVYILDSRISPLNKSNKSRIEAVARQYQEPTPVWIAVCDISKALGMSAAMGRGSLSQYARLFSVPYSFLRTVAT